MKKYFLIVFLFIFLVNLSVTAQTTDEGIKLTMVKQLPATPVKNQAATGTCYTFSAISFLESELIRMGKGEYSLSEMFMVYNFYIDKMDRYIRMHGQVEIPEGGELDNVIDYMNKVGLVPEEVYTGLNYGSDFHNSGELYPVLVDYIKTITKQGTKVPAMWKRGAQALLDTWLGAYPSKFTYKGKDYTPMSFAKELGLRSDDYVYLTAFTHKPLYKKFVIDVPDNWSWGAPYNITLDEMEQVVDNAIMNGYTVAWSTDLGGGPAISNGGIFVVPQQDVTKMKKEDIPALFKKPIEEQVITPEIRQKAYDSYQTTDDHGMHIVGIANDQAGHKFYYVKNSWGARGPYNGYLYFSAPFFRLSTTSIMVHKDALPKEIAEKLGLR